MLSEIGVDFAQGYGIGRPRPFDELLGIQENLKAS
jgi:EAL domain-containing protein (putative c-di-GMP-specific phosphodiesterase class I)